MKKTTSTKIVNFTKSLVTLGSNFGIFTLSFFSIASLVLFLGQFDISQLMPEGGEVTRSGYEAWGGINAFVLTFVGITELILNPAHIIFNFSIAAFLFIASLVLTSIKNQFSDKVA